jgi:hypothetical protein
VGGRAIQDRVSDTMLATSSWRKENWVKEELEVGDEERGRIDSEVIEFIHCLNLSNSAHPLLYSTRTHIRLHEPVPLWARDAHTWDDGLRRTTKPDHLWVLLSTYSLRPGPL